MIDPDFHDVVFPARIAFGATGGPERATRIVRLGSGHERRDQKWQRARRRYDAGQGVRTLDDLHEIVAFWEARRGPLHAFRYRDPVDHKSCAPLGEPSASDVVLGEGDGARTRFALVKRYGQEAREIALAVPGTVRVAVDGAETDAFAVDGGEIVLDAAPPAGAGVSAGFVFDVPVRFAEDMLSVSVSAFEAGQIPSIPLIEVLA